MRLFVLFLLCTFAVNAHAQQQLTASQRAALQKAQEEKERACDDIRMQVETYVNQVDGRDKIADNSALNLANMWMLHYAQTRCPADGLDSAMRKIRHR